MGNFVDNRFLYKLACPIVFVMSIVAGSIVGVVVLPFLVIFTAWEVTKEMWTGEPGSCVGKAKRDLGEGLLRGHEFAEMMEEFRSNQPLTKEPE